MPATPDQLFAALDALGIKHTTVKHPPLFTVEQCRALRGQIPGGHTKNLFLRDKKDALYLVMALEDAADRPQGPAPAARRQRALFVRLGRLLREVLGVEPGSVTPFGALNDTAGRVTVVLDAAMMAHATLNFHPLVNTMTTTIARDDLVQVPGSDRPSAADRARFPGRPAEAG